MSAYRVLYNVESEKVKIVNIERIALKRRNKYIFQGKEEGVAIELLSAGVPQEDIVLAFYPPEERYLTEFAVA